MRALWACCLLACATPTGPAEEETRSESCASCHADHGDDHRLSPHARAAASPVFAAMLPDVEAEWGPVARQACEGCHAPAHSPDEGIGCVSCHAAVGNHETRDGALAVDLRAPIGGPRAGVDAPHAVRQSAFLSAPELCGTCHELSGPRLAVEPTFTEYLASPQAADGETCASCHMPTLEGRRSHRFVGFDPLWDAPPEEAARAEAETLALLRAALALRVTRSDGALEIAVTNVGAGHAVPTGAAFLRDLWVDVERDGVVVAARVMTIGDQPMQGETPVPLLTRASHVVPGSLAAGETRVARVAATDDSQVILRGRAVRPAVRAALGLEGLSASVPVHEIARR